MVLGTQLKERFRWPALHLRVNPGACQQCGLCDRHCPMSLPVARLVWAGALRHAECILCGNCVDHCPQGAIQFSFGRPP